MEISAEEALKAPGGPDVTTHRRDEKLSLTFTGSGGTVYGQRKLSPVLGVCPENPPVGYH